MGFVSVLWTSVLPVLRECCSGMSLRYIHLHMFCDRVCACIVVRIIDLYHVLWEKPFITIFKILTALGWFKIPFFLFLFSKFNMKISVILKYCRIIKMRPESGFWGGIFKNPAKCDPFLWIILSDKTDHACYTNTVQMTLMMAKQSPPNTGTARPAAAAANREVGKRTELV